MGQLDSNEGGPTGKNWPPPEPEFVAQVPIPEHQLVNCIGRGSYGQVWRARNMMGAYRAVKIVFRQSFDSQRPFERELSGIRRFEPISRSHEGFIDVLQVGINEERGYFYYIMELGDDQVSGQKNEAAAYAPNTLASEIGRRGRLSLQECLQLGLTLSSALAALHKRGLVHRDVKPSNIIFVDGVPKLADIGLVAGVADARSYVGTEGFIPPEGPGDPQADIYSLGKVLYEASTGRDRHDFPEMPAEWSGCSDYQGLLELNEIILQACQPEPKERYASAWEMHADLLVVVNGKSVKRLRVLEQRMALLKRGVGLAALFLAIAAVIAYQVYREWHMAAQERQRAVNANVSYGNRAMEAGDLFAALPYFAEGLRLDERNPNAARTDRLRLGSVLAQCPKLTQLWLLPRRVNDGAFSPDGQHVLLAGYFDKAEIYDVQTGKLYLHAFGPAYGLRSAAYSPDGRFIVTASESYTAIVWDSASLLDVLSLPHTNKVYSARFSPDGRRIVTACKDGFARVWDAGTGRLELTLPRHAEDVTFAGFSHDGQLLVTASHDETARIWHANDGRPATPPLPHPTWVDYAAFSPDDRRLVTACYDHRARVWDVATGKRILPDLGHNDAVKTAEFSPDGRYILTSSFDGTARLWNSADLQPFRTAPILTHAERLTHASFSSDGRQILSTCIDGSVRMWDLAGATMPPVSRSRTFCRDGRRFLTVTSNGFAACEATNARSRWPAFNPRRPVEQARLTSDGAFVLTVSQVQTNPERVGHVVQVWNAETGRAVGPGIPVSAPLTNAVPSDDGQRVAIYGGTTAQIWDVGSMRALSSPLAHPGPVGLALFSPPADLLLTVSETRVQVWKAATGRPAYPPLEHPVPVGYAAFSRDGRFLVTCCADAGLTKCYAQIWNARTGRPVGSPLRHGDGVLSAWFSRSGDRIVTASEDFTAKVWEVTTGRQLGLPLRHAGQVQAASFSTDARWVATASSDHTARLWDPQSGDPLSPPLHHLVRLAGVMFLPDARHFVTTDPQGNTFEWELPVEQRPTADLIDLAQLLAGGEFVSPVNPTRRPSPSPSAAWQRLRAKYPRDFAVSREDIVRWHEFQVEESEAEQQWNAAAFHLERLLSLRPGDPSISEHLAKVRGHLERRD